MKHVSLLVASLSCLLQTITAQTPQAIKQDPITYNLVKKVQALKLHEGLNFVAKIEKDHSFYAVVEKGEITKWLFKEKDGKKYYPQSNFTKKTKRPIRIPDWCSFCFDIPGWGYRCAWVPCAQPTVATTWTLKVNSEYPAETKALFDGKKVKQGENKIVISKNSFLNLTVQNGKITNAVLVAENYGITITVDLIIAMQKNPQGDTGGDMCDKLLTLCKMQCALGGGGARDPMHPGTCDEQCDNARKACLPFNSLNLGGITLY